MRLSQRVSLFTDKILSGLFESSIPSIEGLTDLNNVLMAETDGAICHVLWLLYTAVPDTPMAVAAAVHLAGGHGALVFLTGHSFGPEEIVVTIRIPKELCVDRLRKILALSDFVRVKTTPDFSFEEWIWAAGPW